MPLNGSADLEKRAGFMTIVHNDSKSESVIFVTDPLHRAVDILSPIEQKVPFVFASPHSGSIYPPAFVRTSALDSLTLRKSEDIYVDQIFSIATDFGAPLVRALFPRAFLDPNREPYELDQSMFVDKLPSYVNINSPMVASGLGTIAKIVSTGANIYTYKLLFSEAKQRIDTFYFPYHSTLTELVRTTQERFGYCLLIDCHSMPSIPDRDGMKAGSYLLQQADVVLGDCFGLSCARPFMLAAERALQTCGYLVARNRPYSGGYTTRRYGQPVRHLHALQIELNRRLYVDESTYQPLPGLVMLKQAITTMIAALIMVVANQEPFCSVPRILKHSEQDF